MAIVHLNTNIQQKIFDGSDTDLFQSLFQFELDNLHFQFRLPELEQNEFEDLTHSDIKEQLISLAHLTLVNSIIAFYKSTQGLRLYYWQTDSKILLFSFGEYQPGRFQFFFECALDQACALN